MAEHNERRKQKAQAGTAVINFPITEHQTVVTLC